MLFAIWFACSDPKVALVGMDVVRADLQFDISNNSATADMVLRSTSDSLDLVAENISIVSVEENGEALEFTQENGLLQIVPSEDSIEEHHVRISYTFANRSLAQFDGWMPTQGITFIWPNYCGNLYPCNPDTRDGVAFSVQVTGVPAGQTAISAVDEVTDAPPYMPAFAVGEYTELPVGTTEGGISVSAWYLDGEDGLEDAQYGVWNMLASIDFMEQTYGPYAFGNTIGTVEVDWGADSYGGMEHHPFFHVGAYDFWNEETQIHEVAHGWFGDAVRLECWEDFVLSEGTVTYMTAKTLQEVGGGEYDLWEYYVQDFLEPICQGQDYNAIVMPEGCNDIDFENDNLWSLATYMKGACFYEEVGDILGESVVDQVIAEFYQTHRLQSATMEEMVDLIYSYADANQRIALEQTVSDWLLQYECPTDYANRCLYRNP